MIKVYLFLIIMGVIGAVGYGGYLYYKDTQPRIATLTANNAKLEIAVQISEESVATLQNSITNKKKIEFNNKIIHQSKLLNYFKEDYNKKNIDKDLEYLLKKIKKNKKYFFQIKDQILLESLKADGVQIPKKYENIYEPTEANIPYDIQVLINNNEIGLALLRFVEIIGEDKITDVDSETLYFIISALNQLNTYQLRNKILLKVLPLKV